MIVSDINRYIDEHGEASTMDMALHFSMSPDALQGILDLLTSKGRVRPLPSGVPACGSSCCGCAISSCETQRWQSLSQH